MRDGEAGGAPTVTVVIPLHNGAALIGETLTSIQRQTWPVSEVIVVDDGSTDHSADIARRHAVGARVITQPNRGVAVARNRGLSAAKTDIVTFLDQDDLWHPTHVERAVSWLNEHEDEEIVFVREIPFSIDAERGRLGQMDALAGSWAHHFVPPEADALDHLIERADTTGSSTVEIRDLERLLRGPISGTTSFFAKPSLLQLAGGFAPHALAMDDYWLLVNVAYLRPIPQIDQPTVFYRVHASATSRTTRLGLPFLSSAIALRLGGAIVSAERGIADPSPGELHRHLLLELLRSPEYSDRRFRIVVNGLAGILWPRGVRRLEWRARLVAELPWLNGVRRAIRRRR